VEEPVEEPVDEPAEPRPRRRRGVAAEAPVAAEEAVEEAEEEAEPPSGPRRSARRPARSPATRRRNLRESRRILAENGINAENAREGAVEEEHQEGDVEEQQEGAEGAEGGEMGPLGMIGAMLKSTVNYLKTDPYRNAFKNDVSDEPYPSLTQLYETAKENPNSPEILRQVTSDFRALKQGYHDEGCDTDVNISMNPRCLGVQAGLYMRLFDIRKSIDDSLEQMKPIQQRAVLARINREARPEYNGEEDVFVPAGI
jgi:pyruvate/2-oxoglutarate dehydrogenase complex dihydrolipoamide acyltransferase (E2) component